MIRKIRLQNWKSHSETELQFAKGINVLVGPMGSGKSSVLQGMCFALFGSVPEVKRRDVKVSELVKRNSGNAASIELDINSEDKSFIIQRAINAKGSEATVRDNDGVLLAGTNPTQATAFLKNILKLDEDTFLRTVYAKQNEIDLFLQLNPQERKTRLDELMNLHKFEAARKNAVKLANQLQIRKDAKENTVKGLEIGDLQGQLSVIENEISVLAEEKKQIADKLLSVQKEKLDAEAELREIKKKFDEFARLEERQKLLIKEINEIRLKMKEPVKSQIELKVKIDEIKGKLDAFETSRYDLNRKIEGLNKELAIAERESGIAESKLSDVQLQMEKISVLKIELEQLVQQLGVENPKEEFEKLDNEIRENDKAIASLESEARILRKHMEELKGSEGTCPICTRELEKGTRDKLVKEREDVIFEIARKIEDLKNGKTDLELQRRKVQDFVTQREDLLRDINKLPELEKQQKNLQETLQKATDRLDAFAKDLEKSKADLDKTEREVSKLRKEDLLLKEQLYLAELKGKQAEYEKDLADVQVKLATRPDISVLDSAESGFRARLREFEELSARQKSLDFVVEEKNKRLADLVKKQKQAELLLVEVDVLEKRIEFLQQFKNSLLVAQEMLRKELITVVNDLMSSLWSKLYPYEKWTSVHLEASETDYTLQLRTSEGEWVNVAGFASGGERMLAALVLRLAFAKVLAPEFNILILDEPTHNLDDAAINMLMLALQEHLPEFLEQLFIVTHEEKLAEVGDNIIRLK